MVRVMWGLGMWVMSLLRGLLEYYATFMHRVISCLQSRSLDFEFFHTDAPCFYNGANFIKSRLSEYLYHSCLFIDG